MIFREAEKNLMSRYAGPKQEFYERGVHVARLPYKPVQRRTRQQPAPH